MNTIITIETSNVETLAQEAYQIFAVEKKLKLYVNRSASSIGALMARTIGRMKDCHVEISPSFRAELLKDVKKAVSPSICGLYFKNKQGQTFYINQAVVDRFTEITRAQFPQMVFFKRGAIVDRKTGIELMPIKKKGPDSFATVGDEVQIDHKIRAFVAKLNKTEVTEE